MASIIEDLAKLKLPRGFADERSHKASQLSNEHSRATAQACLLINGGAATAVLAYLAKERIDPELFNYLPVALFGYTLGVLWAAAMLYCATESLDHYNQFWLWMSNKANAAKAKASYEAGKWWWGLYRLSFALTLVFFVVSNGVVSILIYRAPPPQVLFENPEKLDLKSLKKK